MLRQPVLVGTNSVEASEKVSAALEKAGIPHEVLNARHHEREARIITRAGEPGAVTVATTMAGRGTDIRTPEDLAETIAEAVAVWAEEASNQPGGGVRLEVRSAEEVTAVTAAFASHGLEHRTSKRRGATIVDVGVPPATAFPCVLGMRVIGFERLAEGRLDRQLRGRTGRQGAPGMSRCYLCLDDEVVLIHGDRARLSELGRKAARRLDPLCERPVRSHRRLLEEVQRAWGILAATVERARERLQKLDAVDQGQREHYDAERRALLGASQGGIAKLADQALERAARDLVREALAGEEHLSHEQLERIDDLTQIHFERRGLLAALVDLDVLPQRDRVATLLGERLKAIYDVARRWQGPEAMAVVERTILLDALTGAWRDLSGRRPELREQSDLMAYAGKQPDHVYRGFAGIAYHETLAEAARTAASVLVTFPLPRELKTPRTGLQVTDPDILALFE